MRHVRLPAEWEPQGGVLLTWPHGRGDFADALPEVEPVFVDIARRVAERERVLISCFDAGHRAHVADLLLAAGVDLERVSLFNVPSNDVWVRDHGPITVLRDGHPRLLDFVFNGWGGKYPAELDDAVPARLYQQGAFGEVERVRVPLVLEGGSIESDGAGTLLTTRSCLLHPGRNPGLDAGALEQRLREWLGAERVLWVAHGRLAGDDTDGHIDTLARFCDAQTIAHVVCEDADDPHFEPLARMRTELAELRTADGQPYRLVPLPLPAPIRDTDGRRLPATYANFLIINGAVLVPVYDDPTDRVALERLADCFPDRKLVAVPCRPLIAQNGSLHCATMQLPVGVPA